ncbi:F0F1 ATP synthase subunit delta [Pasteurellaceae bacterium TAE3-ERU1]|uniref:F0F1 ATP synthase subunit delta n=1 Tax=Spirabiliibacterium mucosae TaxID=28156 RepID=UPI001AAE0E09|nr:F0F1 ATP synthase subunit delta [Spirabiliibacterium mucosae]MBE2898848.1 F0F1 ATP synthase subunit delta [Spirabiliibacterium mucosae]MBV7388454.1 F0F1 ATP synthase subunit delta [Pasteurellaceae bacterium TAE3-ERU1]
MSEYITVARPYAHAAFDFALEHNALDKWLEMLKFAAAVVANDDMQQFLKAASSSEKAANTVIEICGEQLCQHGQNFIRVLAENNRLLALPEVLALFEQLVDEQNALVDVEVISAKPLSEKQQHDILQAMEKRLARKVKLNCRIDESLIGGAIIKTQGFEIDGSSRGQLDRLANALQL